MDYDADEQTVVIESSSVGLRRTRKARLCRITPTAPAVPPVSYTFTGSGWGHSVGMSQWGAYAMAQQGFTYEEILKFYYTGISIAG